ncbi:MAG: hypothetical protein ACLQNE_28555 [Thermoguttaceae bacterium]
MVTAKAKIRVHNDYESIVPIVIPELNEVRGFAAELHARGEPWMGDAFGWRAEYHPQQADAPLGSNLRFTPADFCIGESGIWFFSLMWEHGKDSPPVEFLDDRNILIKAASEQSACGS